MARSGQSSAHAGKGTTTQRRPSQKRSSQRHTRPGDDTGLIPVLARAVREVAGHLGDQVTGHLGERRVRFPRA